MTQILAIETATDACSAALLLADGTCLTRCEVAPRQHAILILGYVDALLKEAGLSLKQIDAIAFGAGPGSFMGLRLAASVAQGLAFGAGLPVVPISTLRALAQVGAESLKVNVVASAWDARMNEIYWGIYQRTEGGLVESIKADTLSAPGGIGLDCAGAPLKAVGNGWVEYRDALSPAVKAMLNVSETLYYPTAEAVAHLAKPEVKAGNVVSPENALPVYLRDRVTG